MKRTIYMKALSIVLLLLAISTSAHGTTTHEWLNYGTITVYVGEEATLYHPFPNGVYVNPSGGGWFLRQTTGNSWVDSQETGGAKIVSKDYSSCTIKGIWDNTHFSEGSITSKLELYCKGTRQSQNEEYVCSWTIIVKERKEQYKDGDGFTAKTQEGVEMQYHVISAKDKTCEVGGNYEKAIEETTAGEITIPNNVNGFSVIKLGDRAFGGCNALTAVHLPNSITEIGSYAFANCYSLESINLPNSLRTIGSWAFNMAEKLTSPIVIPEGVTVIEELTFNACKKIPSVKLPSTLKTIRKRAFDMCYALNSVNLPEGLSSIGESAFSSAAITSLSIPASLVSIGSKAFRGCSNIESIMVANGNTVYDSRNNCNAIIETKTNTLLLGCKNTVISLDVTSIGDYSFYYCRNLTKIELPEGLKSIGIRAFENSKLSSIIFPNTIRTIGEGAFLGNELTSVILPMGTQIIGEEAFYGNKLRTISIPESVVSIGEKAFAYNIQLSYYHGRIYSYATQPLTINENVFYYTFLNSQHYYDIYNDATLFVPQGTKTKYESAEGWKNFKNIVEMIAPDAVSLPATATIREGETITLTPTVTPSNAEYTLTWSSDDETVATVSQDGMVTGVKKGKTFINVETDNGKTAYCKLTVTAPEPIKIELPKNVTVTVGETITLTPTITPEGAETTLTWKSDDESVARISANGVLTGVAEGLALVTVSTSNGLTSNACKVTVEPDLSGISTVMTSEKTGVLIYSPSGQRLSAPRKGVNIVGGKKVVIK